MNVNQHTPDEPIAIVGIACKLPGDINHVDDLWNTVTNKIDTLSTFPKNRIANINSLINNNRSKGKIVTKKGGFIADIEKFDANFFQISTKEAEKLDPQQRLLLETSFHAIEDAGIPLEKLYGSKTGVFIGCWLNDFEHKLAQTPHDIDVYSTTGSGRYPLSGRLSFFYNLQGPSITIDTACSSSLVATHLAMQSLKAKECHIAFAGAANAIVDSFISIGYSRSGLLSEYGACHFGSSNPDGYVRSEGSAIMILKRLQDAIADQNHIYAVLPASVCNNDGASDKYMLAPSSITQQVMIEEAYEKAKIDTNDVQYIEAHGTGTKAGDPSEINAIWNALSKNNRSLNNKLYVGSIKTNIGHTESVAGFAGLFKTIMAMKHQTIPPNLHFYEPNPEIAWKDIGIEIPTENTPWLKNNNKPLIAGVNAFGITGTNAHVVVQSYDEQYGFDETTEQPKTKIFPISANHQNALQAYASQYASLLNIENYYTILKNVCIHKSNLKLRNAIVFTNYEELSQALQSISLGNKLENIEEGYAEIDKRKIAFIFPGQGSQWIKMGKELYQHQPIFKQHIDECEIAFSTFVDWKLTQKLFSGSEKDWSEIDVIQPALIAIEIALAKLWINLGVQPYAVVGHSMGEVAAAYIAGIIELHDVANIICTRSKLMKEQSGKGAMGYVALPSSKVQEILEQNAILNVNIGVVNSPKSTVITGNRNEVQQIINTLETQGVFSRLINVDVASHSNHMDILKNRLHDSLKNIQLQESKIIFQSTVEPNVWNKQNLDATYWVDNLRNTVCFSGAIQHLIDDGVNTFIEISPNPILSQAVVENFEIKNSNAIYLSSLDKNTDDENSFAKHIAQAYCNGVYIDWKKYYGSNYQKIRLPDYPWQKEYYWIESSTNFQFKLNTSNNTSTHQFLQEYLSINHHQTTHVWNTIIDVDVLAYLKDHTVKESIVFPASGFVEIILAACNAVHENKIPQLENIQIHQPLVIDENKLIKIILQKNIGNLYNCTIVSEQHGEEMVHCTAQIIIKENTEIVNNDNIIRIANYNSITHEEHYANCSKININYGNAFRCIEKIIYNNFYFIAEINTTLDSENYIFHPCLLDACFQVILAPIYLQYQKTFVPYRFEKFIQYKKIAQRDKLVAQVKLLSLNSTECIVDLKLFSNETCVALAKNILFKSLENNNSISNEVWHKLESIPIDFKPTTTKNDILIIHNNATSELFYQAFVNNQYETRYLDINDYSEQSILKSFRALGINKHTQLIFCIDIPLDIDSSKIQFYQEQATLAIANIAKATTILNLEIRLWCIVKNALVTHQAENISPLMHQVPAFIRVLWNENNELKPSVIDIQKEEDILHTLKIIHQQQNENEIAIRGNNFYATRLKQVELTKDTYTTNIIANDTPFVATMNNIGVIDNIAFKKFDFPNIASHEVLVEIQSIGVNFMNLLSVLGICPGKKNGFGTLGIECVGIAKKVGENIHHIKENDLVYGMAYHTLASHTIVNGNALCKAPNNFSIDELTTIPAVFITVYYSLVELARIKKGDKVLIHAATGGVGLAAIQICKLYECEIFATAGSDEKRNYLNSIGVDNVYNSRNTNFYDEILEDTNGTGVDVVLNSLTGEAMYKSLELLSAFGRFIEIGKKDIFDNNTIGLEVFKKSLSYFMVDAEKMLFDKPEILGELLQDITTLLEQNKLQPLPYTAFDINNTTEAFRMLNTSKHIGKIVINFENKKNLSLIDEHDFIIKKNASYLLTGAFGGLGWVYAKMLLDKGAKHLVLMGRNLPNEEMLLQIKNWETQYQAIIQIEKADVCNELEIKKCIQNIPNSTPLKGVFHLAGLLDDATINNLSKEKYFNVVNPKILGALHLHHQTQKLELDYFVLFSSSAVLFSSPGQAAYVAANAFLDALAYQRKQKKLPAISIQWSTIDDVGLATLQQNRATRLKEEGVEPISSVQSLNYFLQAMKTKYANIGIFKFDVAKWKNYYSSAKENPYFDLLKSNENSAYEPTPKSFIDSLKNTDDANAIESSIETKLKETIASVTKIAINNIQSPSTFKSLGIDSLMSIQLKNQLEKVFDVKLSVTAFWTYSTVKNYTKYLAEKLNIELHSTNKISQEQILLDKNSEIENEPTILETQKNIDTKTQETDTTELDELSKLLDEELKNI